MILSCNSCEKKFVVPDNAIGSNGRLVQCSSCGNKWKEFPPEKETNFKQEKTTKVNDIQKPIRKTVPKVKKKAKKKTGPDLYSPEYLVKKHGIKLSTISNEHKGKSSKTNAIIGFGFYNYILVILFFTIFSLRLLYFIQGFIVSEFPMIEVYLDYLFEAIRNLKEIFYNFLS